MKDIAILTKYYKNYNYGGILQGYALYKTIIGLGKTCDIISYDAKKNPNPVYSSIMQQCKQYGISAAIKKTREKCIGKLKFIIKDTLNERIVLCDKFMKETGADTELYEDSCLEKLNRRYVAFISGSDQVWNPNAVRNLYLQNFISDDKRKIAYAASIGRSSFSNKEANILIPNIERFDFLGVREYTAKSLLEEFINKDIKVVIDPTLLLTEEEWQSVAAPRQIEPKYALFYFFSDSYIIRKRLKDFCRKKQLAMVIIPYAKQEFNFGDGKGDCIQLKSVGPHEFISAIKYADYVFTDSFHGAVFSIIHQKEFVVFDRNKMEHVSMNSRLYDLLALFNLSNRLISLDKISEMENIADIDYNNVNATLNRERKKSLDYLKNAIGIESND
jgi:hypothetical protein